MGARCPKCADCNATHPASEDDQRFHRAGARDPLADRKSTRLNSSHGYISYAVFCLKKKKKHLHDPLSLFILPLSAPTRSRTQNTTSTRPSCATPTHLAHARHSLPPTPRSPFSNTY